MGQGLKAARKTDDGEEAARLGSARVVTWNGNPDSLQYEYLLQCVRKMTDGRTVQEARRKIP